MHTVRFATHEDMRTFSVCEFFREFKGELLRAHVVHSRYSGRLTTIYVCTVMEIGLRLRAKHSPTDTDMILFLNQPPSQTKLMTSHRQTLWPLLSSAMPGRHVIRRPAAAPRGRPQTDERMREVQAASVAAKRARKNRQRRFAQKTSRTFT